MPDEMETTAKKTGEVMVWRKLGLSDDHRLAELASATYAALVSAWNPAEIPKEIGFVGSWIEKSIADAAPRLR